MLNQYFITIILGHPRVVHYQHAVESLSDYGQFSGNMNLKKSAATGSEYSSDVSRASAVLRRRVRRSCCDRKHSYIVSPLCSMSTVMPRVHGATKERVPARSIAFVKQLVGLTAVVTRSTFKFVLHQLHRFSIRWRFCTRSHFPFSFWKKKDQ